MSLYTKYRPHDWDSVIGQDTISTILRTALKLGQVGHAYILTGSRGTGKTTSARILAEGVNCENLQDGNPCHECSNCKAFDEGSMLDVIEIDAASNTGVDNIRDLIEKARFEPTQGKFKVYIIDEVHMLSTGAFNALLKTLEEPPPHVKFILATTEIDKVPETIRSRSLRFDFRKITEADIVKRLEFVVKSEGITAEKEALNVIAKAARGGLRDALTLLEQHTINGQVQTEYVRNSLSLLEETLIDEVIDAIVAKDLEKMLGILDVLRERHILVRGFFDQILYTLRDRIFDSFSSPLYSEYESIFAIFESAYSKIKVIPDSMLLIEITLIRGVKRGTFSESTISQIPKKHTGIEEKEVSTKPIKKAPVQEIGEEPRKEAKVEIPEKFPNISVATEKPLVQEDSLPSQVLQEDGGKVSSFSFISLLNSLKTEKPALVADLKNAHFEVEGTTLKLIFSKDWNYSRVNVPNIKNILTETLEKLFGGIWSIECQLGKGAGDITEGIF